jgi:DNA-binding CsgD family transcriptional regulator
MTELARDSTAARAASPDDRTDASLDGRMHLILSVALASIVVGGTADLLMDAPATWLSFHVVFETLMIAGALVMATTLWLGWWRSEHAAAALRASLEQQSAERDRWRASARHALEGLGRAIDAQFAEWHLTPAEREVALLLLKGYGHKQAAALTDRSERTVRQHAGVVYQKSGLSGRAELSAFFLQDLMLPGAEGFLGRRASGVQQHRDEVAGAARHHEQVPDGVAVAQAVVGHEEGDAAGIAEATGGQPREATR